MHSVLKDESSFATRVQDYMIAFMDMLSALVSCRLLTQSAMLNCHEVYLAVVFHLHDLACFNQCLRSGITAHESHNSTKNSKNQLLSLRMVIEEHTRNINNGFVSANMNWKVIERGLTMCRGEHVAAFFQFALSTELGD